MDVAEWNLELERVLPQLKVTVRSDNKVKAAIGNAFASMRSLCWLFMVCMRENTIPPLCNSAC